MKWAIIDLDAILCEYDQKYWDEIKENKSKNEYDLLKLTYRTQGAKRTLPLIREGKQLCDLLHHKNYLTVVMTARPLFEIPEVLEDTLYWLKSNNIKYDLLFRSTDKVADTYKYFRKAEFIVDDCVDKNNGLYRTFNTSKEALEWLNLQ